MAQYYVFVRQNKATQHKKERDGIIAIEQKEGIPDIHFFLKIPSDEMTAKNH